MNRKEYLDYAMKQLERTGRAVLTERYGGINEQYIDLCCIAGQCSFHKLISAPKYQDNYTEEFFTCSGHPHKIFRHAVVEVVK